MIDLAFSNWSMPLALATHMRDNARLSQAACTHLPWFMFHSCCTASICSYTEPHGRSPHTTHVAVNAIHATAH